VPSNALVDTGPLVALFRRSDRNYRRARRLIDAFPGNLITTWPVVTEICHLLPPHAIDRFMAWASAGGVVLYELPPDALPDLKELMRKYADLPMDLADASLVWLADQIDLLDVVTLDNRDFAIYRTTTGRSFRNLLPL
jgi:predicted nucleic acid-binding protein